MTAPTVVADDRAATSRVGTMLRARELGIVLALVALIAVTAASNPRFLSVQSLRDLVLNAAILVVLAVGQAVVVITRNIDLSVGSVLGLSAYAVGSLLQAAPGTRWCSRCSSGSCSAPRAGWSTGRWCGSATSRRSSSRSARSTPSAASRTSGRAGSRSTPTSCRGAFLGFGTATILGIPWLILIAVAVVLGAGFVMRNYRAGRELYAMGSNPEAARLAGIPVGRRTLAAFVLSGALAGLAGVLFAARFGTVDAAAGTGYELNVVAAVVVGGVAVFGGSGTVYGAAVGALLLTTIGSALPVLGIDQFWQQAIVGGLILLAIGTDRIVAARVAARLRRRESHVV